MNPIDHYSPQTTDVLHTVSHSPHKDQSGYWQCFYKKIKCKKSHDVVNHPFCFENSRLTLYLLHYQIPFSRINTITLLFLT